jgi:hypothetical protein
VGCRSRARASLRTRHWALVWGFWSQAG